MNIKSMIKTSSCFLLAFVTAQATAQGPLITIAGSNTIGAKLGPACARGYLTDVLGANSAVVVPSEVENEFTVVGDNSKEIYFTAHGSSTGFRALKQGNADIAMASRPIKDSELAALSHLGDMDSADSEHTVAIDGLALIVHPNNPVKALTTDQLSKVFAGEYSNWQQLGGFNAPIQIFARDANSGTFDTFKSLVLKGNSLAEAAKRFESNAILSKQVANTPAAIGFTSIAAIGNNAVLAVAENQTRFLEPNLLTVASEDYLLSRRLFMYTPQKSENNHTKEFIDYCLSNEGQDLVAEIGFVAQKIQTVDFSVNEAYPAEYRALAAASKRLSVNFRFSPSSAELDTKAVRDIERLVSYAKSNADAKVALVGFSGSARSASKAKIMSKMRALAVKNALRDRGVAVEEVLALGDSLAVADSGSAVSKTKNGRVEVWITKSEEI